MSNDLLKTLIDQPSLLFKDFKGYVHFQDPTTVPFQYLSYPSFNCSVPLFDRIVPDLGKTLIGQDFTENTGIIGNKEKFKNMGGIEMEVRVFASLDTNLRDVIEAGFQTTHIVFAIIGGAFQVGEYIAGQESGATAKISSISSTVMFLTDIVGIFQASEQIIGLTSDATANANVVPVFNFQQITENVNPLPRGRHEYYFDDWFETNIDPSISKNLPRLIWVNGYRDTSNPVKGEVYSWTGGIAVIVSIAGNTLSIDSTTTWRSLGFSEDINTDAFVVVNGVSYQLTDPTELDTSVITLTVPPIAVIGDIATSLIETDESPIPFDVCSSNKKGYMFYGNWTSRELFQSNAYNRSSTQSIIFAQATQNDLVLSNNANYTGQGSKTFRVTIDSLTPEVPAVQTEQQAFIGTGNNTSFWDTSAYDSGNTDAHFYSMVIISDLIVTFFGGVIPAYTTGEIIIGNTSGALLTVVDLTGAGAIHTHRLSGNPITGETFTGQSSGVTSPIVVALTYSNSAFFYKDFVQVTGLVGMLPSGALQFALTGNQLVVPYDGLQFTTSQIGGNNVGDYFTLVIQNKPAVPAQPDTFQWQIDSADPIATGVSITGGNQTLQEGIRIKFVEDTGHKIGDYWDIFVEQGIDRAWVYFYYSLPVRKPGEGYKYRLPSNFWTMRVQEQDLYVNCSYGEWGIVSTILSSDLQSESVILEPLKQAGANKVLYPYLIENIADKLVYITIEKELQTLGREELIEKPQTRNLSDPVRDDFTLCNFIGGRIKYNQEKIYISSPEQGTMLCYDTLREYWQPPKKFAEMGVLSVIGSTLVAHSNIRNRTFTMFTNTGGDNGEVYEVSIRTSITPVTSRWSLKNSNNSFIEGYIQGNPQLIHSVYLGVNGCGGIYPHEVSPIVCLSTSNAPFGKGSFGSHSFGSDNSVESDHFQEIFKGYAPNLMYYLISLGLTCSAKSHTWSLLSMGMNAIHANQANNKLVNPNNLSKNNELSI